MTLFPNLVPVRPKILACHMLDEVEPALAARLGMEPRHVAAGFITCDQDDALYLALDHATKFADVDVVYAKSFYAGSAHASGPLSGEILGVIAGPHPDEVSEGLWAIRSALQDFSCFYKFGGTDGPTFFPQVIGQLGRYLAPLAGVEPGTSMAYLIAPPLESVIGLDAALKRSDVRMARWFGPPTETNFGGAYLVGELADVENAAREFTAAIEKVVRSPLAGIVRPERERR
ncbi:ethanolamine utilization microcompartment protein EutL [Myxococcota bacterium]|nr:ethanolamine utilization microcompartment protein EutL [Myxococcota bacterium]